MSIRTFDWAQPGVKRIVRRVLKTLKPGDIIEMHDGDGDHLIYQHSRLLKKVILKFHLTKQFGTVLDQI